MAGEIHGRKKLRDIFNRSGPLHLTHVDWGNAHHRRSVAATLVQGVYVLERDRQKNHQERQEPYDLARWWQFFHFQLHSQLVDDVDSSIFGAIYRFEPSWAPQGAPKYVVAFRGTILKGHCGWKDLKLNLKCMRNGLHCTPRFATAMQAVWDAVAASKDSKVWIAGHSLGSAIGMLAGKTMAKTGVVLETFLFNPPFYSAPIEWIKPEKVKHGIRIASSLMKTGLTMGLRGRLSQTPQLEDAFSTLSAWVPSLFIHPDDHISSEYIGYFEHRKKMVDNGAGRIGRLATQNNVASLVLNAVGRESEPLHLLPSVNLVTNLSPAAGFRDSHRIQQWWRPDLHLQSKFYKF